MHKYRDVPASILRRIEIMANNIIGRILATEKKPTTIDDFTFWTAPELILNPFDIVKAMLTT